MRFDRWISPLCLLLALAMLIAGFSLLAVEPPAASLPLHQARAAGDEPFQEAFETRLARRRLARVVLIGGMFGGTVVLTVLAFATLGGARRSS